MKTTIGLAVRLFALRRQVRIHNAVDTSSREARRWFVSEPLSRSARTLGACVLAFLPGICHAQNLLINGSFETPALPAGTNTTYLAGSPALTGWTITGQGIDHDSAFEASHGNQSISLAWLSSSSVAQTIPTILDEEYCLTFDATRERPENPAGQMSTRIADVLWNNTVIGTITLPPNPNQTNSNMMWQSFSFKFKGGGPTGTLKFTDKSTLAGFGVELDNCKLTKCNICRTDAMQPKVAVDQRCGNLSLNVAHYSIDTLGPVNNPTGYVSVGQHALASGFAGLHVIAWDRDGRIMVERLFRPSNLSESMIATSVDADADCNVLIAGNMLLSGVTTTFVLKLDPTLKPIAGARLPAPTFPANITLEAGVDVQADWLVDGTIAVYDRLKVGPNTESRITRLTSACQYIWMQRYGSAMSTPAQFIIHDIEQHPDAPFDIWASGAMSWSLGAGVKVIPMVMKVPVGTGACNAPDVRVYDFPPLSSWTTGRFNAIKFSPTNGPNFHEAIVAGWSSKQVGGPFPTTVVAARMAALGRGNFVQRWDNLYTGVQIIPGTSAISMETNTGPLNAIVIAGTNNLAGFGEKFGFTMSTDQNGTYVSTMRHGVSKPGSYDTRFSDITPGAKRVMIGTYSDLSPFPGGGARLWFSQHACPTVLNASPVESVSGFALQTGEIFCNPWEVVIPLPVTEEKVGSTCSLHCKYCYPDCDFTGTLSIDDFICFQTLFALDDPYSDCDGDGALTIDDFICFQTLFALGC